MLLEQGTAHITDCDAGECVRNVNGSVNASVCIIQCTATLFIEFAETVNLDCCNTRIAHDAVPPFAAFLIRFCDQGEAVGLLAKSMAMSMATVNFIT